MSIPEKQLGLIEISNKASNRSQMTSPFSFTADDNDAIHRKLFSGSSQDDAKSLMLRIIFGDYADEQEKQELLASFRGLVENAALEHFDVTD